MVCRARNWCVLARLVRRRKTAMTPAEVLEFAKKNGVKLVDFKFVDLLGQWQHTTMPKVCIKPTYGVGFFASGNGIRSSCHSTKC
jgi:hypothetical protein